MSAGASSLFWEEAAECGVCGSSGWRLARTICARRYVVCRGCRVLRLHDRVAEARLELLYGRGYYPLEDPSPAALAEQLRNPTFEHRRARLDACIGRRDRRILEIGCGDGNFLAVMRRHGWDVSGQEFSAAAAALVTRRHRITAFAGDLPTACPAPFAAVGAYHVLEHVYHPREWLQRVRAFVEPGGLLHLQVPNGASLTRRLAGGNWASFVFPEHVYFYTPATLRALLEVSGFRPLTITTWDPWHGPGTVSRSITNTAHRVLTGRSPWTDTIGQPGPALDGSAHVPAVRSRWRASARTLLDSASRVLARFEAVVGRGAVVDIIAERC